MPMYYSRPPSEHDSPHFHVESPERAVIVYGTYPAAACGAPLAGIAAHGLRASRTLVLNVTMDRKPMVIGGLLVREGNT